MRRIWDWIKVCTTNRLPDGRWLPKKGDYIDIDNDEIPRKVVKVSVWNDTIQCEGDEFYSIEFDSWADYPKVLAWMKKIGSAIRRRVQVP